MINKQGQLIEERMLEFGVAVIRCSATLNLPRSVVDQVVRSSTSIGANYSEAQNAASKQDFRNKIFIAKKEAAETRYWLRTIIRITPSEEIEKLISESHEILLILQAIINKLRTVSVK